MVNRHLILRLLLASSAVAVGALPAHAEVVLDAIGGLLIYSFPADGDQFTSSGPNAGVRFGMVTPNGLALKVDIAHSIFTSHEMDLHPTAIGPSDATQVGFNVGFRSRGPHVMFEAGVGVDFLSVHSNNLGAFGDGFLMPNLTLGLRARIGARQSLGAEVSMGGLPPVWVPVTTISLVYGWELGPKVN
jgi:hypothetical protein